MKDKLHKYALIAEIIGSAAIVISLIFVGVQINQNSNVIRANSWHSISESLADEIFAIGSDQQLSSLWRNGLINGRGSLTDEERGQFDTLMFANVRRLENIFVQYQSGLLDEDSFYPLINSSLEVILFSKGGLEWWNSNTQFAFSDAFVQFINQRNIARE